MNNADESANFIFIYSLFLPPIFPFFLALFFFVQLIIVEIG